MSTLDQILASTENANGDPRPVSIVPTHVERGLYQTHAARTLQRLLDKHGEDHLRFVLATILQSENNADALLGPVIDAVSDLARLHPEWADRASEWMDAFDEVRLIEVYERAKALRAGGTGPSKSEAVFLLLADRLAAVLGAPVPQRDLFR